jgi:hypothetical protein
MADHIFSGSALGRGHTPPLVLTVCWVSGRWMTDKKCNKIKNMQQFQFREDAETPFRCTAMTARGTQCSFMALPPQGKRDQCLFCRRHAVMFNQESKCVNNCRSENRQRKSPPRVRPGVGLEGSVFPPERKRGFARCTAVSEKTGNRCKNNVLLAASPTRKGPCVFCWIHAKKSRTLSKCAMKCPIKKLDVEELQ